MARLRRQKSFEDVCAEGLFRATTVPRILAQRGAIFTRFARSSRCRWLSLCKDFHQGGGASSRIVHLRVVCLCRARRRFCEPSLGFRPLGKVLGIVPLLESDSSRRVLPDHVDSGYRMHDRLCTWRRKPWRKSPFAAHLGPFPDRGVSGCLLFGPPCRAQLAAHVGMDGQSMYSPDRSRLQTSSDPSAPCLRGTRILPPNFVNSSSAALVADAVWAVMGVLIGATLGTLASIPWIIACKAKLRGHALMLEQMACFDCRAAQCTIEADRVLVEQQARRFSHRNTTTNLWFSRPPLLELTNTFI